MNYFATSLTEEKLRELITKMKIAPRDLLRTGEAIYRELNLKGRDVTDDEIIRLMVEHPDLIQRPIVERGHRAVLAHPTEKVKEVMSDE